MENNDFISMIEILLRCNGKKKKKKKKNNFKNYIEVLQAQPNNSAAFISKLYVIHHKFYLLFVELIRDYKESIK